MKTLAKSFSALVLSAIILQAQAQTISSFPHHENFESFTQCGNNCGDACTLSGGWVNLTSDGGDWTVYKGSTPTLNTGPDTDHNPGTSAGNYLYVESSGACANLTAAFTTPPIDLSSLSNFSLEFWYHMYGATQGALHVDVSSDNGTSYTDDVIPSFTNNADIWVKKTINLDTYAGDTIIVRLRGVTGNGGTSDMAVDDFTFYTLYNNDAGITAIDSPANPLSPGNHNVVVTLQNYALNPLSSATVGWSVNGIAQSNYNWNGNLANGQTAQVNIGNYNFASGTTSIKVWTSNPNTLADQDNSNDTTLSVFCSALSGTYSIGGGSPDYATLGDAATALANCGISGPVIFNVASGTYNEQLSFTSVNGATAVNTITFSGNGATLSFAPNTDNRHVIKFDGAKHFVLDNFQITGTDATYGWGIFFTNQADSNVVKNCTIDVSAVTSTGTSNSAGIVATGSGTSVSSAGNNASALTIQNNTIIGGYQGIRIYGAQFTKSTGNIITGNQVRDFYSYGIYFSDCSNSLVSGNNIQRASRVTVGTFYGIYIDLRNEQLLIEKNRIHNTHDVAASLTGSCYGIYTSGSDAPIGKENKYVNNVLYNFNGTGTVYGIYNSSSDGSYYFHNTVSLDDTASTGTSATRGFYQTTTATNLQFKNNIITIRRGGTGAKHCIYLGTATSSIAVNNNAYFTDTTANNIGYYSGDFNSLADWQTANAGAYDGNSVFGDPLYVNVASDFTPTNGLLNNTGDSLGITSDINGNSRSASTPDPGAYEFTPPTVDVSVSWVAPLSPTTPGSKTITVKISNSIASLPAITDLSLTYTDGVTPVTESFSSLNITPGTSADISFATQYNLTGFTIMRAYINTANGVADAIQTNDTVTQTLCPSLSGAYTINKQLPTGGSNFMLFSDAVAALSSCGISAPVTFDVVAGSGPYFEQVSIPAISGSGSVNTVTFNCNNNVLNYVPTSASRHVLKLNGADYITFNNLTIVTGDTLYGWGVHLLNGAEHNTFNQCTIDVSFVTSAITGDFAGMVATNSNTSISASGDNANYITVSNCTFIGGGYALRFNGSSTTNSRGINITGNTIRDFYSYGIYLTYTDSTHITANDISRANRTDVGSFYGIYLTTGAENTWIERNSIHNTHDNAASPTGLAYPIYFTGADAQLGKENYVINNLLYNINSNGTIYGIYNSSSDYARYYHNTIALDDTAAATTDDTRGFYQTTTAANVDFRNNIITVRRGGTGTKHCIYLSSTTSSVTCNNNVLLMNASGVDNHIGRYGTNDYSTLPLWQTANGNTFDQNSVSADPLYADVANADFTPQNSTVNNKGANVGVTSDYNQNPRNVAFPDPGAFEFTPSGLDAAISWVSPVSPTNSGLQTITVNVSNAQTVPVDDLTLSYTDGASVVTESFHSLGIAGGSNLDISFTTPYNLVSFVNVRAYIDSVNFGIDQNQSNDTTAAQVLCSALSGTYTINKNAAASASNFVSFTEAVSKLSNCGISAPVVINVVAGSGPYNEQISIPQITGASAANTVTINGNNETLTFAPTTDNRYLVRLDGAKHFIINNLRITGTDATYGYGIHLLSSADSNVVAGCRIDISAVTSTTTANSAGILFSGTAVSTSSDGNNGNYNTFTGNEIIGGYYGVRINGLPGTPIQHNEFTGNIVRDFYSYGFYLGDAANTVINGNNISRANRVNVSTFYGVYLTSGNLSTNIRRNRIHDTHGNASSLTGAAYPIYFSSCDADTGSENLVINNAIYNINSNGTIYALYNSASDGVFYYHNSISLDDQNSSGGATRGFYQTTAAANLQFINNIISIKRSGTGTKHCIYLATTSTNIISDYNLFYTDTAVNYVGYLTTTNYAGLDSWKTANGNAYDQNSLFDNPFFGNTASGNLTPLNSFINDAGTSVGVTVDINQNPRSLTTPDVGAFEFTPVAIDATVVALLEPEDGSCGENAAQVSAVVTNFGSDTLSSVPVTAILTGAFSGTLNAATGTIAGTESDTVSFGTINLSSGGAVTFTVFTNAANDGNTLNDTLTVTIDILPVASLPVILAYDDSICINQSATISVDSVPNLSYHWYDAATGGNQLHSGATYTTPPLVNSALYFVEASSAAQYSVGPADNTIGSGSNFTSVGVQGMLFDVFTDITLDSVSVYANDTGTVYVELSDASNTTVIDIVSAQVSVSGTKVTIPVGFAIPQGSYRLDANGTTTDGLYRNDAGANYPYEIPGVMAITGNTFDPLYYYYFYDWKITGAGCPGSRVAVPVFVNTTDTAVTADFNYITSGLDVTFSPIDNRFTNSYAWDFGDGTGSTIANIAHQYAGDGTYNACLTVSNACSQETTCRQVTVCGALINDFDFTPSGLTAVFTFTGVGLPDSYAWNFGDGDTSTAASPSHTYPAEGTYDVTLLTTNACGGADTFTGSISICESITADFTATQVTPNGLAFDFTDNSAGTVVSYAWSFGDGATSASASPAHTYAAHGSYTVTLITTNACGISDTATETVRTCLPASAGFTATVQSDGATVITANSSAGTNLTYNWNFGDGATSTAEEPTHVYAATGSYTITLTATDACGTTATATQTVSIITGITNVQAGFSISATPNPTSGQFVIRYELQNESAVRIRLLNILGEAVYENSSNSLRGAYTLPVDLQHVAKGAYLLEFKTSKGAATLKVMIE